MRTLGGIWIVLVAFFAIVVVLSWRRSRKRREALALLASQRGWTLVPGDDSWARRWHGPPFDRGDHRRARNILIGNHSGRPCVAFDYSYQTHSTDSEGRPTSTTHRFSVVALALPTALPPMSVTREGRLGRLASALGRQDIELESEAFNRRYRVRADNPKFATDVLNPRTMQALLDAEAAAWRIDGRDILSWHSGTCAPQEIDRRLAALAVVVGGIPSFVWKSHGLEA